MDRTEAILAELDAPATQEAQPETQPEGEVKQEAAPEETEEVQTEEKSEEKPVEEFSKKARNALSYRDKKIGKLQAELQRYKEDNERLTKVAQPEVKDDYPKEESFQTYGDYLKAVARFEAKQELKEVQAKQVQEKAKTEESEWESERAEALDNNAVEAKKAFSDFDKIVNEAFADTKLAPHVMKAFLEADNPAYALYALIKEGDLAELNDLSANKVAMKIARFEDKGLSLSKIKKSNAPAPMAPNKGLAPAGKQITGSMNFHDLKKELGLK